MLYSILCNRRTTLVHDPIPVIDHPRFCTSSPLYLRRSKRTLDCIFSPVDDCSFYSLTVLCLFKTVSYLFLASIPRHHVITARNPRLSTTRFPCSGTFCRAKWQQTKTAKARDMVMFTTKRACRLTWLSRRSMACSLPGSRCSHGHGHYAGS